MKTPFLALVFACAAFSQVVSSRLAGVVLDPSGAAIPHAGIVCIHRGTAIQVTSASDDAGYFFLPSLTPGVYIIEARAPGFRAWRSGEYELTAGETATETITLQLGDASTTIEVSARVSASRLQTSEGQLSRAVTLRDIESLPQVDRDPMVLANQHTGVAYSGAFSRVNGTRQGSTATRLDGVTVSDPDYPYLGFARTAENTDSVTEFRILLAGGKAEYGRNGGAQIQLVTRSGGNRFSGNLYEYLRNTALNANDFFNNTLALPVPRLIRNQFGGSAGGAVRKDATFFFVNFMSTRIREDKVRNRLVLTAEARRGLYRWRSAGTATVQTYDIPRNDPRGLGIDARVAATLNLTPEPNNVDLGDGLNNGGFRFNSPANSSSDQWTGKLDHNLGAGHRLFLRYSWKRLDAIDALNNADARFPGQPAGTQSGPWWGFAAGSDWHVAPQAVNELRLGRHNGVVDFLKPARPSGPALLVASTLFTDPVNPAFSTGRSSPVTEVSDHWSIVRGRHVVKLGGSFAQTDQSRYSNAGTYPNVRLMNEAGNTPPAGVGPTGQPGFADLYNVLLGRISAVSLTFYGDLRAFQPAGTPQVRHFRFRDYALFWQDDWRVNRRLTVNLGLRWEYFGRPLETGGLQGRFESAERIDGVTRAADLRVAPSSSWFNADANNFAPRIGFAYDPSGQGRMAFRGTYGVFYDRMIGGLTTDQDSYTPGLAQSVTVNPNVGNRDVRLSDGIPLPSRPDVPVLQLPATRSTSIMLANPNLRTSYFQHFSLGVQYEIARDALVEAGYVGTRGVKLILARNVNQPRIYEGFLQAFREMQAFVTTGAAVPPGNVLVRIAGSPSAAANGFGASNFRLGLVGNVANTLDLGYYPLYASAGIDAFYLRNYPQYLGVLLGANDGRSYYDSLQVSVRRSGRSFHLNLNYTFSKNIDNINFEEDAVIDSYNLWLNRGRSNFDVPHSLNLSAIWTPSVRSIRPAWAARLAGGWEIGLIGTVQSGFPFTADSGLATTGGTTLSSTYPSRANYTGDRNIGDVRRLGDGVTYFTAQETARFSYPAAGDIGNSGRNAFRGPGMSNLDLSLVRRFALTERQSLLVRGEFYNALNHPSFANPAATLTSPSFGRIGAVAVAPRRVQLAMRWEF